MDSIEKRESGLCMHKDIITTILPVKGENIWGQIVTCQFKYDFCPDCGLSRKVLYKDEKGR